MASYFSDKDFVDSLLTFVCKDRAFLKKCGPLLDAIDFRPRRSQSMERWTVATIALEFWDKYREPVGALLRTEIQDYAKKSNLSQRKQKELEDYATQVLKRKPVAAEAIEEKVIAFKKDKLKTDTVQELIDLHRRGQLTDDRLQEICQRAIDFGKKKVEVIDYFSEEEFEKRLMRRQKFSNGRYPLVMIDPIDRSIRVVNRGHVGLLMGPYKAGKSMGFVHLATAYPLQGLNVLYITLEDPREDVEDRLDASLSALPLTRLSDFPNRLRKSFYRFRELLRGRIRIIDSTESRVTVKKIEEFYLEQRNRGFLADVVLVDYDAYMLPSRKFERKNEGYEDIYIHFNQFIKKYKLIGWLIAQATRGTDEKKIVVGDDTADAIDKQRKVSFCLTIGKGEWGDDSMFLWVANHKNDRKKIGWNIMSDKAHGLLYDRDKTIVMMAREEEEKEIKKRRNGWQ